MLYALGVAIPTFIIFLYQCLRDIWYRKWRGSPQVGDRCYFYSKGRDKVKGSVLEVRHNWIHLEITDSIRCWYDISQLYPRIF